MARLRAAVLPSTLLVAVLHAAGALPVRLSDSCDDMPSAPRLARQRLGRHGHSRPSKDGEESLNPSWTDLRNMAESCAEFFEQEREGGDPAKVRRSEKARLKKLKNEDLQVIKDVLAKAEVEEELGGDRGGAQRFWPNAPTNSCDVTASESSQGLLSSVYGACSAVSALFAQYVSPHTLQRTRHDEVCYRENTFPKAKRYASADWLHILRTWPQSTVMIRILSPVLVTTAWTFVLALLHKGLPNFLLILLQRLSGCHVEESPVAGPCTVFSWLRGVNNGQGFRFLKGFSKQPHGIVGSAMSLLLVFRTNTAYTRFWEGRCQWESVSDYVRDITRFCVTYRAQVGESNLKRIADLLCAFPVALKHHLEGFMGQDQEDELANLVDPIDLPGVLSAVNRPLYITNALMHIIVHDIAYQMDQWTVRERLWLCSIINQLSKCVGGCERLVQTPVPLHYARHTGRFMGLFVLTLPLILVDDMGMLAVPAVAIMVWCIFGVQVLSKPYPLSLTGIGHPPTLVHLWRAGIP
jgi:predicted membrane chloride channel (bestrophin family)